MRHGCDIEGDYVRMDQDPVEKSPEKPEVRLTKSTGQTWEEFEWDFARRVKQRRIDNANRLKGAGDVVFSV
ncbi:MAG TPA: hypothetical protein VLE47_01605 [Candidatus Saccharimonadales bacterium]|nr:hypothetical protein [Candidatus Saccharimonadales bacterium]